MVGDYNLTWGPADLAAAHLTIERLQLGLNEEPMIMRLLNYWMQNCFEAEPNRRAVHSQWIDKCENLIEGYTQVSLGGQIPNFFGRGKIYKFSSVFARRPRRSLRTCPAPFLLKISAEDQLEELPEDPTFPWFPIDGFYPTSFSDLRNHLHLTTDFRDIVGRLLSVSEEETGPFQMPTIAAILEDCNGNTIMVKHASLNHALSQAAIVVVERSGPVILAFTSMLVTEIEDSGTLCLLNTAATRIIQGCWSHRFKELRNAFSHVHRPVTIGHSPTYGPAYVQHRLPPKTTLFKLMASKAPSASQQNHSSVWCLIKIKKIPTYTNLCHSDPETNPFPRFQMNVECEDVSTTSCILFFDNDAASSLLKKSAQEYLSLNEDSATACLNSVVGQLFAVEIEIGPGTDSGILVFKVITLWDLLVFGIEARSHFT